MTVDRKPWFAVEVKAGDETPSKHLGYFAKKLRIPYLYQVIGESDVDVFQENIHIMGAPRFLSGLV